MSPPCFRRIRLANDPATLGRIRAELDRLYPTGDESGEQNDALVMMATLKRARLMRDN